MPIDVVFAIDEILSGGYCTVNSCLFKHFKFSFKQVDVTPPEGKSKDCLLCLVIKDGELKLCAEDADDMRYSVTYLFMITKWFVNQ